MPGAGMTVLFFNVIAGVIISAFSVVEAAQASELTTGKALSTRQFRAFVAHRQGGSELMQLGLRYNTDRELVVPFRIMRTFKQVDRNDDGSVSRAELTGFGLTESEVEDVMEHLDNNGDGNLTLEELMHHIACTRDADDHAPVASIEYARV